MSPILERIFSYLNTSEPRETNNGRLASVRLVNRHWNYTTQGVIYRQVTLTRARQLKRLNWAVDRIPFIRSQIFHLSIPKDLLQDALQTRSELGGLLPLRYGEQGHTEVGRWVTTTVLGFISKLPSLNTLCMHPEYALAIFNLPDDIIRPPHWNALINVSQLHIIGVPCIHLTTSVGTNPSQHPCSGDIPSSIIKHGVPQLAEKDAATPSLTDSEKKTSRSSLSLRTRGIRSLYLINVSPIFTSTQLQPFLAALSGTLETLTISSSNPSELGPITQALAETLPRMSCLTHLSTNTYQLRVLSPALHTLRISLVGNPSFCFSPHTNTQTSLPFGTIFDTITGVLDFISSCSSPPSSMPSLPPRKPTLKSFTIEDASMEEFLHFHLVATDDWDASGVSMQNRLWMTASQLGVLIEVKRRDCSSEEQDK